MRHEIRCEIHCGAECVIVRGTGSAAGAEGWRSPEASWGTALSWHQNAQLAAAALPGSPQCPLWGDVPWGHPWGCGTGSLQPPRTAPRRPWALHGFKPSAAWVWGRVGRFLYRFWVCLPRVTSQDGSTCEKTSEGEKDGGFVNRLLRIFLMVLLMPLLLP